MFSGGMIHNVAVLIVNLQEVAGCESLDAFSPLHGGDSETLFG